MRAAADDELIILSRLGVGVAVCPGLIALDDIGDVYVLLGQ